MALSSKIKSGLNRGLEPLNLKLATRTAEKAEQERIETLARAGQFERPVLPILPQFLACDPGPVLRALKTFANDIGAFAAPRQDGFSLDNSYFTTPDADVAYAIARLIKPARIVEVGSGNSTFLFREAIRAEAMATELVSIDPMPRRAVEAAADRIIRTTGETAPTDVFTGLQANDILFIDSSHEVKTGNDVVTLALTILPRLKAGVVVHFHDILLPYEYPRDWVEQYGWTEQYLVHAMLQDSDAFEVIWAGHFLQHTLPGFESHFPHGRGVNATSLWLRRREVGASS
jgi:predicted O-methyltransferase YrrM